MLERMGGEGALIADSTDHDYPLHDRQGFLHHIAPKYDLTNFPLKTPTITNFPQALHHQEVSYQIYVADDGTTHETESHEDGSLAVVEGTVHIVQDTIIHGDVSFYA